MGRTINQAIATYKAETTPAAIRRAVRLTNAYGVGTPITAADVRASALAALQDALAKAA